MESYINDNYNYQCIKYILVSHPNSGSNNSNNSNLASTQILFRELISNNYRWKNKKILLDGRARKIIIYDKILD